MSQSEPVANRLDAIIRLLVEYLKQEKNWNAGDLVLYLQSSGLRRVEIAKILGVKNTSLPSIVASAKNKDLLEKLKGTK